MTLKKILNYQNVTPKVGVEALNFCEVKGFGHQKGHNEAYLGREFTVDFLPETIIETMVADDLAKNTLSVIVKTAKTGKIGAALNR